MLRFCSGSCQSQRIAHLQVKQAVPKMQLDRDAFLRRYEAGRPFVLRTTMVGDLVTPVAAFLKLRAALPGPAFLLESVEGGAVRGRYSMIGLEPDLVWRCRDGRAEIAREPSSGAGFAVEEGQPLDSLRSL